MATFVLVHGCSGVVVLDAGRHAAGEARAPRRDVRSAGARSDSTPIDRVTMQDYMNVTMQDYVNATSRAVAALKEVPILVGHSMGGPIAGVAESAPDSIAALVFVAGLLPRNGGSLLEAVGEFDPQYLAEAVWAADRRSVSVSPRGAREFLYPLCPAALVDQTIPRLSAEPIGPYETAITTSSEAFGRVPSYYVETARDRVVRPAMQKSVQARIGCRRVFSIDTDHSPFFSTPDELVSCLELVAADL